MLAIKKQFALIIFMTVDDITDLNAMKPVITIPMRNDIGRSNLKFLPDNNDLLLILTGI